MSDFKAKMYQIQFRPQTTLGELTELPRPLAGLVDSRVNHCCHQMSDFKAKMYQIQFWLGLRPRPRWGSLQRSPRIPSWIKGAYF